MMAIAGGRPFLRRDVRGAFSVAGSKFQTQPTTMPPHPPMVRSVGGNYAFTPYG